MPTREKARDYEQSHPWIKFLFDTRLLDHESWLLLGEAKSKCEHILGAPLLPSTVKQMYRVYLVKGALATTAIEGNTLTEEEVERRIRGDLKLPPSKEYLGKEIDNIVKAYNYIGNKTLSDDEPDKLSVDMLADFNRMVLQGLPLEDGVVPGVIRNYPVHVGRYHAAPCEDCEYLTKQYVNWLNEMDIPSEERLVFGILKAIMAHLYFVWIHPFGDGNGRTARLIEFQILLSFGAPAVVAHLLSNHYNLTRTEYYRYLDRASRSEDGYTEFVKYALQGFVDGLREEIESIQKQQVTVHWINHIHDTFKGRKHKTEERQKDLMLDVSSHTPQGFGFDDVRHITPRVAEMYSQLSNETIKRDLQELVKEELLIKDGDLYLCNFDLLNVYRMPARE